MVDKLKITPQLIEKVVCEVAGKDVIPLVKALKNRQNISEFKLASEIHKEINITRNMLYRLYHANLVSFTRKKDKKKGWYIYYWTFNLNRIRDLTIELKKKRIDILHERLSRERKGQYYSCDDRCMRLDFERACDFEYKCPECGKLLNLEDNTKLIEQLEQEMKELQKKKVHI